jgi:hypothetical protein
MPAGGGQSGPRSQSLSCSVMTGVIACAFGGNLFKLNKCPRLPIAGHIGPGRLDGVRQIVSATRREGVEAPVTFDELQDRDMIVIGVIDKSPAQPLSGLRQLV